jgi:hypothetical protein
MQMLMPGPCKRFFQDLVPQVEKAVIRVRQIRSSQPSSDDKKIFEYLVDENHAWITKDQLRVSLNRKMLSELKGNSLSS